MSKIGQSVIDHIVLADEGTSMLVVTYSYDMAERLFDEILGYVKRSRLLYRSYHNMNARIITEQGVTITFIVAHKDLSCGRTVDYLFLDHVDEYSAEAKDAIYPMGFGGVVIEG